MEVSVVDAVQALSLAVTGLLPPPASPDLAPEVTINPVKTHPAGIGGYIGLQQLPVGEIFARRMQAQVVIRVKADSIAALGTSESAVTNALVGASPTQLRSQGIFRIARDTDFAQLYQGADDGLAVAAGKDIRFDVDFEFRRLPDAPSGLISSLPLDLLLHATDTPSRLIYGAEFDSDPLAAFAQFDDEATSNGPGSWRYDAAAGLIEQTSEISGGSNSFNPSKRGSYLVLQPGSVPILPDNWLLHAELGADSGGIGLVFNFQDIDNYYFFIMSLPTPYRLLGKKSGGSFSFLDNGGQDNGNGYGAGDHSLRLIQQNGEFELAIDHTPVMSARENTQPPPGRVGFLSRNSATSRFRSLRWLGL